MQRPDLYVMARFLSALARADTPAWTRSRLQAAVRLNYDLFRNYLALVVAKGWATESDEGIRITQAGREANAQLLAWLARGFDGALL